MWEEWLKAIHQHLGMPQGKPQWVDMPDPRKPSWTPDSTQSVLNSPYADSVRSVTGSPNKEVGVPVPQHNILTMILNEAAKNTDWAGLYQRRGENPNDPSSSIRLNPSRYSNRSEVEGVLAHELGHHMSYHESLADRVNYDKAGGESAAADKTAYANTNWNEHYAEAFKAAMEAIRSADGQMRQGMHVDPARARKELESLDQEIPGTVFMMKKIINTPKFRDTLIGQYLMGDLKMNPVVVTK